MKKIIELDEKYFEYKKIRIKKKYIETDNDFIYKGYNLSKIRYEMQNQNKDISKNVITTKIDFGKKYVPENSKTEKRMIYIHGGAFISGSIDDVENACKYMAYTFDMQVYSISYTLAPEKKYPENILEIKKIVDILYTNKDNM